VGTREESENSKFHDMKWGFCSSCGCVQLLELIDLEVLYSRSHNPSIGKSWQKHHSEFSDFATKHLHGKKVLEIGGANLKIAKMILEKSKRDIDYTVVDFSCKKYGEDSQIRQIKSDFSEIEETFDTILHSHTFEHTYDPVLFLRGIYKSLSDSGTMIMSIPNLENQVKSMHMNALNFEHTFLYSEDILKNLLARAGFEIAETFTFSEWNNFYLCKKRDQHEREISFSRESVIIFEDFFEKVKKDVSYLNKTLEKNCFCFGAHIFTQMLLCFGLDEEKIQGVLDNDPNKIGKFLYGSNLKVYGPEIIEHLDQPTVILRVSQFKEEIQDQIETINLHTILV
jgi:2-polyprenyl-3-methyl-5-hydroxy-6-metoxy-1,4-benzoquinol methylase